MTTRNARYARHGHGMTKKDRGAIKAFAAQAAEHPPEIGEPIILPIRKSGPIEITPRAGVSMPEEAANIEFAQKVLEDKQHAAPSKWSAGLG
jgi:hypothetical protein